MQAALRGGDKIRLGAIRMALAAIKLREIDSRRTLDDAAVIAVLEKMIKQGRDASGQYQEAKRPELAAKEDAEVQVFQAYLPQPLGEAEIENLVAAAIRAAGATGVADMGKVMAAIKAEAQGRVDMSAVAARVRSALGAG